MDTGEWIGAGLFLLAVLILIVGILRDVRRVNNVELPESDGDWLWPKWEGTDD